MTRDVLALPEPGRSRVPRVGRLGVVRPRSPNSAPGLPPASGPAAGGGRPAAGTGSRRRSLIEQAIRAVDYGWSGVLGENLGGHPHDQVAAKLVTEDHP